MLSFDKNNGSKHQTILKDVAKARKIDIENTKPSAVGITDLKINLNEKDIFIDKEDYIISMVDNTKYVNFGNFSKHISSCSNLKDIEICVTGDNYYEFDKNGNKFNK
jgi:hypothetical protein